jgi:hypothetical protein
LKRRIGPPVDKYLDVGITIDGMGVLTLCRLTKGKADTISIPQMETPDETGMDGVHPMEIRDENVDIKAVPPIMLVKGIEGLGTLEKTLGDNML